MDFYTEVTEFNGIDLCHRYETKRLEKFGGQ
jgi:hypothetical protein